MFPISIVNQYGNVVISINVQKVMGRNTHCGILYSNGELYLRGSNTTGHFGIGTNTNNYLQWVLVRSDVKNFWIGENTSLVQTSDNKFFYSGYQRTFGESTTTSSVNVWTEITTKILNVSGTIDTIKDIQLGIYSSFLLLTNGNLYGAGVNASGELGLGASQYNISTYTLTNINVKKIAFMEAAAYALKNDGTLQAAGDNSIGQLGVNSTESQFTSWTSSAVQGNTTYIRDIGLGNNCAHILASTDSSSSAVTLLSTGWNTSGQLGMNTTTTVQLFTPVYVSFSVIGFNEGCCTFQQNTLRTNLGLYSSGPSGGVSGRNSGSNLYDSVSSSPFTSPGSISFLCYAGTNSTSGFAFAVYNNEIYACGGSTWLGSTVTVYTKITAPR